LHSKLLALPGQALPAKLYGRDAARTSRAAQDSAQPELIR